MSFGFPDVCLTPVGPVVVPIPYPNFAPHALAATFSLIVKADMIPALNLASIIAMTFGDEPGVAHWTIKGIGAFVTGNPVVFIEKLPAINLTSLTTGNNGNCPTGMVIAPGAPNVLYTLAPAPAESDLSPEPALEDRLSGSPLLGEPQLLAGGVGLVRVRVFSLALPGALHLAIKELTAAGMRSLVIDLRDCPGGELLALLECASDFLPSGALIATLRDAEGDETPYHARGGVPLTTPVLIAVSRGTASAAELFAGALKAHRRAVIVGERTYGKGVAQALVSGDGSVRLATAGEMILDGGVAVHGVGVTPDLEHPADRAVDAAIVAAFAALPDRRPV